MNINFVKQRKDADSTPLHDNSFMENRIGFWADVSEVDSTRNFVTVVSDTGLIYKGIPVISKEWVYKNEDQDFIGCSINLPPVGARVFVLCPTHTVTGAFVLCSGYAQGDTSKQIFFSDDDNKDKDNLIKKSVNTSGWKKTEFYKNGNVVLESQDKKIKLEICPADDEDESLDKHIYLEAWGNKIEITDSGLEITDKNKCLIKAGSDGIELYKNADSTSSNYIKLGSKIEMKGSSGTVEIS